MELLFWTEYLLKSELPRLQEEFSDPRVSSAAKRTRCTVELTRRVLNRRSSSTEWTRHSIVRVCGPNEQAVNQLNRMLEQVIPSYKQRKEYDYRSPITMYTGNSPRLGSHKSRPPSMMQQANSGSRRSSRCSQNPYEPVAPLRPYADSQRSSQRSLNRRSSSRQTSDRSQTQKSSASKKAKTSSVSDQASAQKEEAAGGVSDQELTQRSQINQLQETPEMPKLTSREKSLSGNSQYVTVPTCKDEDLAKNPASSFQDITDYCASTDVTPGEEDQPTGAGKEMALCAATVEQMVSPETSNTPMTTANGTSVMTVGQPTGVDKEMALSAATIEPLVSPEAPGTCLSSEPDETILDSQIATAHGPSVGGTTEGAEAGAETHVTSVQKNSATDPNDVSKIKSPITSLRSGTASPGNSELLNEQADSTWTEPPAKDATFTLSPGAAVTKAMDITKKRPAELCSEQVENVNFEQEGGGSQPNAEMPAEEVISGVPNRVTASTESFGALVHEPQNNAAAENVESPWRIANTPVDGAKISEPVDMVTTRVSSTEKRPGELCTEQVSIAKFESEEAIADNAGQNVNLPQSRELGVVAASKQLVTQSPASPKSESRATSATARSPNANHVAVLNYGRSSELAENGQMVAQLHTTSSVGNSPDISLHEKQQVSLNAGTSRTRQVHDSGSMVMATTGKRSRMETAAADSCPATPLTLDECGATGFYTATKDCVEMQIRTCKSMSTTESGAKDELNVDTYLKWCAGGKQTAKSVDSPPQAPQKQNESSTNSPKMAERGPQLTSGAGSESDQSGMQMELQVMVCRSRSGAASRGTNQFCSPLPGSPQQSLPPLSPTLSMSPPRAGTPGVSSLPPPGSAKGSRQTPPPQTHAGSGRSSAREYILSIEVNGRNNEFSLTSSRQNSPDRNQSCSSLCSPQFAQANHQSQYQYEDQLMMPIDVPDAASPQQGGLSPDGGQGKEVGSMSPPSSTNTMMSPRYLPVPGQRDFQMWREAQNAARRGVNNMQQSPQESDDQGSGDFPEPPFTDAVEVPVLEEPPANGTKVTMSQHPSCIEDLQRDTAADNCVVPAEFMSNFSDTGSPEMTKEPLEPDSLISAVGSPEATMEGPKANGTTVTVSPHSSYNEDLQGNSRAPPAFVSDIPDTGLPEMAPGTLEPDSLRPSVCQAEVPMEEPTANGTTVTVSPHPNCNEDLPRGSCAPPVFVSNFSETGSPEMARGTLEPDTLRLSVCQAEVPMEEPTANGTTVTVSPHPSCNEDLQRDSCIVPLRFESSFPGSSPGMGTEPPEPGPLGSAIGLSPKQVTDASTLSLPPKPPLLQPSPEFKDSPIPSEGHLDLSNSSSDEEDAVMDVTRGDAVFLSPSAGLSPRQVADVSTFSPPPSPPLMQPSTEFNGSPAPKSGHLDPASLWSNEDGNVTAVVRRGDVVFSPVNKRMTSVDSENERKFSGIGGEMSPNATAEKGSRGRDELNQPNIEAEPRNHDDSSSDEDMNTAESTSADEGSTSGDTTMTVLNRTTVEDALATEIDIDSAVVNNPSPANPMSIVPDIQVTCCGEGEHQIVIIPEKNGFPLGQQTLGSTQITNKLFEEEKSQNDTPSLVATTAATVAVNESVAANGLVKNEFNSSLVNNVNSPIGGNDANSQVVDKAHLPMFDIDVNSPVIENDVNSLLFDNGVNSPLVDNVNSPFVENDVNIPLIDKNNSLLVDDDAKFPLVDNVDCPLVENDANSPLVIVQENKWHSVEGDIDKVSVDANSDPSAESIASSAVEDERSGSDGACDFLDVLVHPENEEDEDKCSLTSSAAVAQDDNYEDPANISDDFLTLQNQLTGTVIEAVEGVEGVEDGAAAPCLQALYHLTSPRLRNVRSEAIQNQLSGAITCFAKQCDCRCQPTTDLVVSGLYRITEQSDNSSEENAEIEGAVNEDTAIPDAVHASFHDQMINSAPMHHDKLYSPIKSGRAEAQVNNIGIGDCRSTHARGCNNLDPMWSGSTSGVSNEGSDSDPNCGEGNCGQSGGDKRRVPIPNIVVLEDSASASDDDCASSSSSSCQLSGRQQVLPNESCMQLQMSSDLSCGDGGLQVEEMTTVSSTGHSHKLQRLSVPFLDARSTVTSETYSSGKDKHEEELDEDYHSPVNSEGRLLADASGGSQSSLDLNCALGPVNNELQQDMIVDESLTKLATNCANSFYNPAASADWRNEEAVESLQTPCVNQANFEDNQFLLSPNAAAIESGCEPTVLCDTSKVFVAHGDCPSLVGFVNRHQLDLTVEGGSETSDVFVGDGSMAFYAAAASATQELAELEASMDVPTTPEVMEDKPTSIDREDRGEQPGSTAELQELAPSENTVPEGCPPLRFESPRLEEDDEPLQCGNADTEELNRASCWQGVLEGPTDPQQGLLNGLNTDFVDASDAQPEPDQSSLESSEGSAPDTVTLNLGMSATSPPGDMEYSSVDVYPQTATGRSSAAEKLE